MKNPYEILGLNESCSFEELKARYEQLKNEYSEGRFRPGEEGNEAARKLTELEQAWQDISARQTVAEAVDGSGGNDFAYVDKLIKEQRYDEAQAALDSMTVREGEWHYFQSIIYYKREWLSECKKRLRPQSSAIRAMQSIKPRLKSLIWLSAARPLILRPWGRIR